MHSLTSSQKLYHRISNFFRKLSAKRDLLPDPRAKIINPIGKLNPENAKATFVAAVGPDYDQTVPKAWNCIITGYCNAFEEVGIPYVITDVKDLSRVLSELKRPFCLIKGNDFDFISQPSINLLKLVPHFVWVDRWFQGQENFFVENNMDPQRFSFSSALQKKILDSEPSFVFSATTQRGLHFYEGWEKHGAKVCSLPLACDSATYLVSSARHPQFEQVEMAFVGGYWESKGRQIDLYLRNFEDRLTIYGYSKWPYSGYRGLLEKELEPYLYRQARVSPTINEPTVALLHGNINERVFKILGSGGVSVVDAVPAYRDLFNDDELMMPSNVQEFHDMVCALLENDTIHATYQKKGMAAVLSRHMYRHRVAVILQWLGITRPENLAGIAE